MIILVAYASVEGHTAKIATRIAEKTESAGHEVILANLSEPGFAVPGRFDGVILCGPIHIGTYPGALVRFLQDWKSALMDVPSALVTVSLAISSEIPEEREEALAFPDRLAEATGWVPSIRHHAAGALKYLEYDFFKRWIMRRISAKEGGPVDTSRDYEFTDWAALDTFTMDFLAEAAKNSH
ncbi:MAG: flavodoxin domain-containing protein [Pseudomonadota bacterium]|nr:flavodoxin domain-containing protein [Pseudomonadota bacterium]